MSDISGISLFEIHWDGLLWLELHPARQQRPAAVERIADMTMIRTVSGAVR